ncbi:MAG: putative Eukaryotic translation initiation factor 5B, partial [Streblomastix strix]
VDILHGLEPQTIESLKLLLDRQTPFVVALNKIDRLVEWKKTQNSSFEATFFIQYQATKDPFERKSNKSIKQFAKLYDDKEDYQNQSSSKSQGAYAGRKLITRLYYESGDDLDECIPIIPTSAHTGEGLPDLLAYLFRASQQQSDLAQELKPKPIIEATVLEVKTLLGLGTTIDVMLVNGVLCEGDQIIVNGTEGPITTQIRSVMTPLPLREIRVSSTVGSDYKTHKRVRGAMGIKLQAPGLEKAVAGSTLSVAHNPEEIEPLKEKQKEAMASILQSFELESDGVTVIASTMGSLEALVTYLQNEKPPIPIAAVSVGD